MSLSLSKTQTVEEDNFCPECGGEILCPLRNEDRVLCFKCDRKHRPRF